MPRVSEAHLAARRQQILDAGRACFARNGFHATSMQDVINEAGLSVGAFYRYFKSKDQLIEAIAEQSVGRILRIIKPVAELEPVPPLPEVIGMIIEGVEPHLSRDGTFAMAIQVWAESLRNPVQAKLVKHIYGKLRGLFHQIAQRSLDAGHLPGDADVEAVASVLFALIPGYALQRVLLGKLDRETYLRGIQACFVGSITQKRLPSGSDRTTKSASAG
jgi:AcrR family transcriptional regulator